MFKKLSKMKILMDYKSMDEGERKIALAVSVMNLFIAFIVGLALYFTICSIYVDHILLAPKDLLDFCKDLTSTFIYGASAVLALYNGGNVLAHKFGERRPPTVSPPQVPDDNVAGGDPTDKPSPKPNNDPNDLIG